MKKLTTLMLGMSLALGTVALAQDTMKKDTDTTTKKTKKSKKSKKEETTEKKGGSL
ncbi:MAG TPA: hypothetical protein VN736_29170 [Candidatus Limnocylindrales bacterium]|nr:hypothetical protein [Candidatus Limnocylindrales bacterium]